MTDYIDTNERFTVGVIVANYPGVLNRISGLFSKRSYNIDSLAVGETEDPRYSRITIVTKGDERIKQQIIKQLRKLHDVKKATILSPENSIMVEHLLIKIDIREVSNAYISETINHYGGKIMDFSNNFITVEITGNPNKISEFISKISNDSIIELCRSGAIALTHGDRNENVLDIKTIDEID